jgi:hypothetical protein
VVRKPRGLFAPGPLLVFHEHRWIEDPAVTNTRHFVIDAGTGLVNEHGETLTAYSGADYTRLLTGAGFVNVQRRNHMGGTPHPDMEIITARRS